VAIASKSPAHAAPGNRAPRITAAVARAAGRVKPPCDNLGVKLLLGSLACLAACALDAGLPDPDAGAEGHDASGTADACAGPGADCPDGGEGPDAAICTGDCADGGAPPPPEGPARYPTDHTLSPLTPHVAELLRAAHGAGLAEDVFAKVGDSITVSTSFLHCFAGADVDLGGRDDLAPTVEHFLGGRAGDSTPFDRDSLAAGIGWSAFAALEGAPSPLDRELDALDPSFAVVMFGTNEVGWRHPVDFGEDMLAIIDGLLGRGVIPLLSSIPPRDDDPGADAAVPQLNAVVRGLAQGRQVPFMDLERELRVLPGHGIGGDGVHLDAYADGGARPCVFSAEGLGHGYNWRNLLFLQTLHRVLEVVLDGADAPDPPQPRAAGEGTAAAPFTIDETTWSDLTTTLDGPESDLRTYTGCGASQDESGPEVVYELVLDAPAALHAIVVDGADVDVDLHLLGGAVREDACLLRHDREIATELDAGVYYLVLDTYVPGDGRPREGEFLLVVTLS
jgi:hypothetical protein